MYIITKGHVNANGLISQLAAFMSCFFSRLFYYRQFQAQIIIIIDTAPIFSPFHLTAIALECCAPYDIVAVLL